jgi:orotidine-5'-phosphate decarboxylase
MLIYALDADGLAEARAWVVRLREAVGGFKIGLQLFLREGPAAVEMVRAEGGRVFLDLKLHDIPHTVEEAAREAVRLGAAMLTVHAGGGRAMMMAAAGGAAEEAARRGGPAPLVLGVTVLTSLDAAAVREIGFAGDPKEIVLRLAGLARSSGLGGVVASAAEAAAVRARMGPDFKIVCPGIRAAGAAAGDQARVGAPAEAVAAGADYLVVGRPIREAADPLAAARAILAEARGARA